ncbi:MAG: hypothetical protein ABI601_13215 [bacterium]
MTELVVRPLSPEDALAARGVLADAFRGTRYLDRAEEVLENALRFEDPEYLCLVGEIDRERIVGLVLFGAVVGAKLAAKVHVLAAAEPRVMLALLGAVRETCERSGERLVVCEIPRDTPFDVAAVALVASGYREEGRIEDFVRDGVALRVLVWRPDREHDDSC